MTRTTLRVCLLAVLGMSSLTACDSGADPIGTAGQFDASVTGAATASLEGRAAYTIMTENGETVTSIALLNEADPRDVVVVAFPGQPRTGTFQAAGTNEATSAAVIVTLTDSNVDTGATYLATSGTVTITRAAGGHVVGRFDVDGTSLVDGEQVVSAEGTFDAEFGEVDGDV
ncbi:MAG TPA: hypothetical protein VF594_02125 [Rubricoccaceae bacterium]